MSNQNQICEQVTALLLQMSSEGDIDLLKFSNPKKLTNRVSELLNQPFVSSEQANSHTQDKGWKKLNQNSFSKYGYHKRFSQIASQKL